MAVDLRAETANIVKQYEALERKMKEKLEEDIKFIRENSLRETDRETENLKNLLDIELQRLRTETEEQIEKISKDRYKDLTLDDRKPTPEVERDASENLRRKREKIFADMLNDKELYEEASKARRARFEQQMNLLFTAKRDSHLLEFLKKNVVELCTAEGPIKIADECVLETRAQIVINRNAVVSGQSWALYKCTIKKKPVLGLVVALKSIPIEMRRDYERACKCIRFLCARESGVMHPQLIKVYEIFATEHKRYSFMEEFNDTSLDRVMKEYSARGNVSYANIVKWTRQMAEVFAFTHKYAIAHMNIRPEAFIFSREQDIKVVGMSRMFPYFDLDKEKILRSEKLLPLPHNSHMPPEAFEEEFRPESADVWSFGLILYEFFMKKRPEIMRAQQQGRRIRIKICWDNLAIQKIRNPLAKQVISRCCSNLAVTRPRFEDLLKMEYFTTTTKPVSVIAPESDSSPGQSPGVSMVCDGVEPIDAATSTSTKNNKKSKTNSKKKRKSKVAPKASDSDQKEE